MGQLLAGSLNVQPEQLVFRSLGAFRVFQFRIGAVCQRYGVLFHCRPPDPVLLG